MVQISTSKSSAEYWEERALENLTEAEKNTNPYLKSIYKIYTSAQAGTVREIQKLYRAYYKDQEWDWDTAALEAIVPNGDLLKFRKQLKTSGLETALPKRFDGRLSRLEMLNAELWLNMRKTAQKLVQAETAAHTETLKDAYYRTIYDAAMKRGAIPAFSTLDQKTINQVLGAKFYGKNFSERVWGNTDRLADSLQSILGEAVALGQSPEVTAREIRERFEVGRYEALRLVRTETNYFHNRGSIEAYREMGFDKFQFIATLDYRTSNICRAHHNKIFSVKTAKIGEDVPPLHPFCRSTIAPWFGEEFAAEEQIARDAKTGKNYYVPGNISYDEWRKTVDGIAKKYGQGRRITARIFKAGLKNLGARDAVDITNELLARGVKVSKGTRVLREDLASVNRNEQLMIDWAAENIGGEVKILRVSQEHGVKTADLRIDDKKVEIKTTSGSLNTLSDHVRKAAHQTELGKAIINITGAEYTNKEAVDIVTARMKRTGLAEVYLVRDGKLVKHIVNKKASEPRAK